jgi:hypothetical protein
MKIVGYDRFDSGLSHNTPVGIDPRYAFFELRR